MKVLLDTHAFLWFLESDPHFSQRALSFIQDRSSEVLVSTAGLWEIAIKLSLGKLRLGGPFETFIPQQLSANDIGLLGIELGHMAIVSDLPLYHRDPFDRMLIAQSITERMLVISADPAFDAYGITRLW